MRCANGKMGRPVEAGAPEAKGSQDTQPAAMREEVEPDFSLPDLLPVSPIG